VALPAAVLGGIAHAQDFRTIREGRDVRPQSKAEFDRRHANQAPHNFVGMWITADGNIRHRLLPGGRYDEARGNRESAFRGRYVITGNFIDYVDDTGFIADGEFKGDILYHYGMVMHRRR
jgi:hypothetical protein